MPKNEKELIPSVRVKFRENNDVDFCDLVKTIKAMGFPVDKNMIYYYSPSNDLNVFCGRDPLVAGTVIPEREITQVDDKYQITIKIRQTSTTQVGTAEVAMDLEANVSDSQEPAGNSSGNKQKRTKERKIGQVIDKVLTWRKLYTGYNDPATGQLVKMSLEEAANKVGISKKSLDDYLLQIRFGKKYGFNFNDHFNDRVGVLRTFVKKHKSSGKPDKMSYDDNKMSLELSQLVEKKEPREKERFKGEISAFKEAAQAEGLNSRSKKIGGNKR
jgi:hypothetical protein